MEPISRTAAVYGGGAALLGLALAALVAAAHRPSGAWTFPSTLLAGEGGRQIAHAAGLAARRETPPELASHLAAWRGLIQHLLASGRVDPDLAPLLNLAAEAHDLGMALEPTLLSTRAEGSEVDLHEAQRLRRELIATWTETAAADMGPFRGRMGRVLAQPRGRQRAQELLVLMADSADRMDRDPEARRIVRSLGHATLGVPLIARLLRRSGLPAERAFGLALLLACHHPGDAEAVRFGAPAVPERLLPALLVGGPGDAEPLRAKLADYASARMGISRGEGRLIAALAAALDRLAEDDARGALRAIEGMKGGLERFHPRSLAALEALAALVREQALATRTVSR